MAFFLGIDGGGSKTECVLADEAGAVLARASGPGSNLRRVSAEILQQHLQETLEALRGKAHLERLRPEVVCGGFAGAGDAKARTMAKEVLKELLQPRFLYVVGDMEVALEAAVGAGPGVVLIAGTGSIAYGRNDLGQQARAGGEGPQLTPDGKMKGDVGSGTYFGWRVFRAVLEDQEAGKHPSILVETIKQSLRAATGKDLKEVMAQSGFGLGPEGMPELVSYAAQRNDAVAQEILSDAAAGLAELALRVLGELQMGKEDILVALSGGVFAGAAGLAGQAREHIRAAAPRAHVELLAVSPAEGAVRLAQRLWLQERTAPV